MPPACMAHLALVIVEDASVPHERATSGIRKDLARGGHTISEGPLAHAPRMLGSGGERNRLVLMLAARAKRNRHECAKHYR